MFPSINSDVQSSRKPATSRTAVGHSESSQGGRMPELATVALMVIPLLKIRYHNSILVQENIKQGNESSVHDLSQKLQALY